MHTGQHPAADSRSDPGPDLTSHASPELDWARIETVLLDMDGTLLDLRFDVEFWQVYLPTRYAEHHGIALEDGRARVLAMMREARPRLDYYCFDWWSANTGLDISALKPDLAHLIGYRPGAEVFLGAVRESGRRSVIVTNCHPHGVDLKHRITGIRDRVDGVECAHDLAAAKEHRSFWDQVRARIGFDPERTLLVDDNLDVLDCASNFGIAHLLAVRQPDSGSPALTDLPFPAVDSFLDLLPPARTAADGVDADAAAAATAHAAPPATPPATSHAALPAGARGAEPTP